MKFLSIRLVSDRRLMNRLFAVLFIGLALLGHTLSQYEGSGGDGTDEDDEYDDNTDDENSGDGLLTLCQQQRRENTGYQPTCLPDGQFASRQCNRGVCFCVDEQGVRIPLSEGTDDCDSYVSPDITFEEPAREVKHAENENIFLDHPVLLAGVIGGVVICLLCAVLVVMFIVYRMKKKDEGSYILGRAERKSSRSVIYTKAVPRDQEFYA